MDPATNAIDWFPLLLIGASALVMLFLVRRAMRGMNQQDWILLRQARARGLDMRVPQPVTFVVFAATEPTAAELAARMQRDGYEIATKEAQIQFARNRKKPGAPQDGWLVSATRSVMLVPQTLTETRKMLNELAAEHKALYLGWQVADAAEPLKARTPADADAGSQPEGEAAERRSG